MQEIPKWIIKVIDTEDLKCRNCKQRFHSENLMSIGIQESSKPPYNDYLCIGLYCKDCKELIIFELKEKKLIDFAFEILDQETTNKIEKSFKKEKSEFSDENQIEPICKKKRSKGSKNSKITLKEISDARKFLKPKDLKHEEFLIALGMLPEEVERYNYKNRDIE